MKYRITSALLICAFGALSANAMTGGPLFCVGHRVTGMTVEASRVRMDVPSGEFGDRIGTTSQRLYLTSRYGVSKMVDVMGQVGAANLDFDSFNNGFTDFSSSPSLAWGGGLRAGYPQDSRFQVVGALSYSGFMAKGVVERDGRKIDNSYLWQEVIPTLACGYRVGDVTPYLGVQKLLLIGTRDYKVSYLGEPLEAASGNESFNDGEQPYNAVFGLEWSLPDGYTLGGEVIGGSEGNWSLSLGLSQALRQ